MSDEFPARALADALYQVQAGGHSIDRRLFKLLLTPPTNKTMTAYELDSLEGELWSLAEYCQDAKLRIQGIRINQ
jgi:hypothetical protein